MKLPIAKKRSEGAKIHIQYNDDGDRVGEGEEKHETISEKRFRGPTLKLEIAKKKSEGAKIHIEYNNDGDTTCVILGCACENNGACLSYRLEGGSYSIKGEIMGLC